MSAYDEIVCPKRVLLRACAAAFGVSESDLRGPSRRRDLVRRRNATCWVFRRRFPEMSYPWLGRFMGGRDHSTIIYAVQQCQWQMERFPEIAEAVEGVLRFPLPGSEPNAHVRAWLAYRKALADAAAQQGKELSGPAEVPVDDELAEFIDPAKAFCAQCDRAVYIADARRCRARLCGLRPVDARLAA